MIGWAGSMGFVLTAGYVFRNHVFSLEGENWEGGIDRTNISIYGVTTISFQDLPKSRLKNRLEHRTPLLGWKSFDTGTPLHWETACRYLSSKASRLWWVQILSTWYSYYTWPGTDWQGPVTSLQRRGKK